MNTDMNPVQIEEAFALVDPFLHERVAKGKNSRTQEFVAFVHRVEAGLLIFEHIPDHALGIVYEIYVLPESRGRGVGNLLLARAQALALDAGYKSLRLMVRSLDREAADDETLASWYGRKGFHRDAGDPGWMRKDLPSGS